MRRLVAIGGLAALGLMTGPLPTLASDKNSSPPPFQCNGTYSGKTIQSNVEVPAGGVCVLLNSTVNGNIVADTNAYLESAGSNLQGDVTGNGALTLYLHNATRVAGNVVGYITPQVLVYDSSVMDNVAGYNSVAPGYGHFQVCGNKVGQSIGVAKMGPDVLIGDPAAGCGANTLQMGSIGVAQNNTYAELYVIGNQLQTGGVYVSQNVGTSDKLVQQNSGPNGNLDCQGNALPFTGSPNGAFKSYGDKSGPGQCH
ncbi:MAG TPA: hypothetical protein VNV65_00075 [Candidatus Solibacter sp.]|jgi:hypothetical protein|nr:hypothetical protein [Candidatus Solibacter sp.]